jgi:SAM-dependent methyltransferase
MSGTESGRRPMSRRKEAIRVLADRLAPDRERWIERNRFYYDEDERYMRLLIPPGRQVLDLGCGTGRLLASLETTRGVGVDFSCRMVDEARQRHPQLRFEVGDVEDPDVLAPLDQQFDFIVLSDTVGYLDDVQGLLEHLHSLCYAETRVVISYYSRLWSPILGLAQRFGQQMPHGEQNWLSGRDLVEILDLADYDVVRLDGRQIIPKRLGGFGTWANRFLGTLPGAQRIALRSYVVARSRRVQRDAEPSTTVVIPCRNEAGNIAPAIERLPRFCSDLEVLFVEGHSQDDTWTAIERVIDQHAELDIKAVRQDGIGKADAVRKGFDVGRGAVLMILDADLTTPPEDLPKFYAAVVAGKGELVMGTRLVYPLEEGAMRTLNVLGNKVFSLLFSWLLNQRITDTLCGTKALTRRSYDQIVDGRSYFGDFDPFGDFDLIFGAAKLNLKIVEVPVRYRAREYGTTQISRFQHGWLLARMVWIAHRKFKAV